MADIFISYTSSDHEWAKWLHAELAALGHVPHIHEWEIGAGDNIYAWMEQRHDEADHVLCVISDAYLKAPFSTMERNAALWQGASAQPGFVIFVKVEPCRLPTLADHLRRCDLFGATEDEARDRFRTFMSARAGSAASYFPGQAFAVSNITINVPLHFMGRDEPLAAIAAALRRQEGRIAVAVLHGLRGVGKTTLSAAYAERHRADYRATWWIRAQTEAAMRADLVALGVRLGWVEPDAEEAPALAAVIERLRHEGEGILLVYDNAIDSQGLKSYLPRGGGAHVLVTSNTPTWRGLAQPVEVRLWPADVGADYLIARSGQESERATAEALSDSLGGLPLAHEQAAAYCERLEIGLASYAKRFAATPARFLDDSKHAPADYHDGLTVAKTFALAIAEATKLHAAAAPLIAHAALLAPEPIPLFLFSEGRAYLDEPLATLLAEDGLDEAVAALRVFALVDRKAISDERDATIATDTIRLHRLVREVATPQSAGATRARLIEVLDAIYPQYVWRDPDTWVRARRLDALALAATEPCETWSNDTETSVASLLIKLGQYRQYSLAAYAGARPLFARAIAIHERLRGHDHPDTATGFNSLARLLQAQGDLAGARPLFERALAIYERELGPDHPHTATSLNNIAVLLQAQGDLAGARPLFECALSIYEKGLGQNHPDTATNLNSLALLLQAQGDLDAARPLFERALAIYETAFGPDHPDTAACLNSLALLHQSQGDLAGARPLFERALSIYEKGLGPDHPDTATSLNNLARLLQARGDLAGARPLFERALAIYDTVLGADHPDTATGLNNLALLHQAQGEFADARALFERNIAICETVLGPDHPDTATGLNNLALLLQTQGDLASARPLFERACAIKERVLGPDHSDTATSCSNFARLLRETGDVARAEALFDKAISVGRKALGPDHSLTLRYQSHYARLLIDTGRAAAALEAAEAALEVHEAQGGPDHSWTKDSARVTADALAALGEAEKAAAVRARYRLDSADVLLA